MSRRPKPVPFTEADLVDGELRRAPRSRRWLTVTVVVVLLALVAAAAYAVTFAPDHYAKWQAERLSGDSAVEVGGGVQVVPEEGWVAQPRVTNLVEWPPLPPLRDWAVLTGAQTGVEVLSPDRGLSVELSHSTETDRSNSDWLNETPADDSASTGPGADGGSAARVKTETLASGAQISHVDANREIRAIVTIGETNVRVLARLEAGAAPGSGAAHFDGYRPALSALLESVKGQASSATSS